MNFLGSLAFLALKKKRNPKYNGSDVKLTQVWPES